jgi:hypothetical protein
MKSSTRRQLEKLWAKPNVQNALRPARWQLVRSKGKDHVAAAPAKGAGVQPTPPEDTGE